MLSRVVCARRVCLSCRFAITQRATARPRISPIQYDLGRRRFASAHDDSPVTKDDILEALMSGKRGIAKKAEKDDNLDSWEHEVEGDELASFEAEGGRQPASVETKGDRLGSSEVKEDELSSFETEEDKLATSERKRDKLSLFENDEDALSGSPRDEEPVPLRRLEDELYDTQTDPERANEAPEDEHLHTEAMEEQDVPLERTISRKFSDEDFDHWAADEAESSKGVSKQFQDSQRPYVIKNMKLDRQNVGVGALGQRLNALVMKNPDTLGHNAGRVVSAVKDLPPSIPFDLEGFAHTADADMEPDEQAFLNLDALRPTDSSTLTRYEYEALRDEIADGFNGSQLILYWRRHKDLDLKPADASAAYPWLRDLGTWVPVDQETFYPVSKDKKAKQHYAYRLMTQIWGLQIQEEVETPGHVVARLSTITHTMLTRPSMDMLADIQADLLDETIGEKITPHKSNRTLSIVARKPVVPVVLARINAMLKSLEKRTISVEGVSHDLVKRETMDELEKVTKTIIMMDPSPDISHIDVYWPRVATMSGANESQADRESPADTVLRLLLGRQAQPCTVEEQVVAKRFRGDGVAGKVGTLTPYHRESRSMSWTDRLAPWARFMIPTIIPSEQKKTRWLKLADKVSFPEMDEHSESSMDRLTATFGHILHAPLPKLKSTGKGRVKKEFRRTVSPVMPHPAAFTDLTPQKGTEVTKQDSLVIHFIPAPGGTAAGEKAPPLKLTMPFTGDEDFSNLTLPSGSVLHAPKSSFVKDLLFPEEVVDARIERHRDLELDISEQSAFRDFIAASDLNLVEGRLQTPTNTRFTVPKAWLAGEVTDAAVDLPYLFGGLEIHQTVDMAWENDIVLRYESIEAGQHGGTRQQLSLVLDLAGRSWLGVQTSLSDFLSKLGIAVEGKAWTWSKGVAQAHDLPHENDPIWDQFRSESAAEILGEPREQLDLKESRDALMNEEELDEEIGALVEDFEQHQGFTEGEDSPAAPRSEVLDWTSAPMAPPSQYQQQPTSSESKADPEAASELSKPADLDSLAELFPLEDSDIEPDTKPAGPSGTQSSTRPFSPTSSKQKDHRPKKSHSQPSPSTNEDDYTDEWAELPSDVDEYESMDPEALAAKLEAERGALSLEEMYRRAGATPEQIAALEEESKLFQEKWKALSEQGVDEDKEPTKEEIKAENELLKKMLAEDIAAAEAEQQLEYEMEEDDMEVDPAEEKRKKKLRKRRD